MVNLRLLLAFLALFASGSEAIRCYECRSDIQKTCGDPFFQGHVAVKECDEFTTNPTFMCFKASQYVAGSYLTVRGCAPFDTQTFNRGMQRSMSGTYFKGAISSDSFSLCDYDNCNSSNRIGVHLNHIMLSGIVTLASLTFIL